MKNFVLAVQYSPGGKIEQHKIQEESLESAYLRSTLRYLWNNESSLQDLSEEIDRIQEELGCSLVEAVEHHAFNTDCVISILELE